jgi:hypothetical protein
LLGQVRDHFFWHVQWVRQERAEPPNCSQLEGKAEPVVVSTALGDQFFVNVIEEERPLQLLLVRHSREPAVARRVVIAQELNGHRPTP